MPSDVAVVQLVKERVTEMLAASHETLGMGVVTSAEFFDHLVRPELLVRIHARIWAQDGPTETVTRTETVTAIGVARLAVPASWWQHLRERYRLTWWGRWPVRYRTVTMNVTTSRDVTLSVDVAGRVRYPDLTLSEKDGRQVRLIAIKGTRWWTEPSPHPSD